MNESSPHPTGDLDRPGDRIAALGSLGGLVVVGCFGVLAIIGDSKLGDVLSYLMLCGIAPLVAALLVHASDRMPRLRSALRDKGRLTIQLFLAIVLLLVTGQALAIDILKLQAPPGRFAIPLEIAAAAAGTAIFAVGLRGRAAWQRCRVADPALVYLLLLAAILYSPLLPGEHASSGILAYGIGTAHFKQWILAGVLVTAFAVWLSRFEEKAAWSRAPSIRGLIVALVVLFIFSLYDDGHYADLAHYMAYVGPALHALHGGVPMVDVYSQYGMLPSVTLWAFFHILSPGFGTAAIAVRVINIFYLLAIALILFSVSKKPLTAFVLLIPATIMAITFHEHLYNLNAIPSAGGMRYLPPGVMALVLITVRSKFWSRLLTNLVLIIASFWSLETFIYALAPWGYVLMLQSVRDREIAKSCLSVFISSLLIVGAHLIFAGCVFLTTGESVSYWRYLNFFSIYRPDEIVPIAPVENDHWALAFNPLFALWVPVWLVYFLTISLAFLSALRRREPNDTPSRLAPLAIFGVMAASYFVGRTTDTTLGLTYFPFAIIVLCAAEMLFARPTRFGAAGVASFVALMTMTTLMVAYGGERFARPVSPFTGNSTVLRRCFSKEGCSVHKVFKRLKNAVRTTPLDASSPIYDVPHDSEPYARIEELISALRNYAPNEQRVAVLVDPTNPAHKTGPHAIYIAPLALIVTNQWFTWPLSSILNDATAPAVSQFILRRSAGLVKDGQFLFVSNDVDELPDLEREIYASVQNLCRLSLVKRLKYISVYEAESCLMEHAAPARSTSE